MNWWSYIEQHARGDSKATIAVAAGVSAPTVSRWSTGQQGVDPQNAARFARSYGRPVLEALVAAGFLTSQEADERPSATPSLNTLTDDELLAEVKTRLTERGQHNASQEPGTEARGTPEQSAPPIGEWDKRHQELVIAEALQPEGIDTTTPSPLRSVDDPSLSDDDGTNAGDQDDENGGRRQKRS